MIFSFLSAKGGVGKTAVVANLGTILAKELGRNVLLVEGNFTAPTLGLHLGVVPKEHTIIDALNSSVGINDVIYKHTSGASIIPSSLSPDAECRDFRQLKPKLQEIKDKYDIILIDGASGIGNDVIAAIEASDGIFIVSEACLESAVAALRMVKIATKMNITIKGMIVNRVIANRTDMSVKELEELWGNNVIAEIPFDSRIAEGFSSQSPAALAGKGRSYESFKNLASTLLGNEPIKKESFFDMIKRILRLRR